MASFQRLKGTTLFASVGNLGKTDSEFKVPKKYPCVSLLCLFPVCWGFFFLSLSFFIYFSFLWLATLKVSLAF